MKRGRELIDEHLDKGALPLLPFIASLEAEAPASVPIAAVFLTSAPEFVPHALLHNLKHNGMMLHERIVICHVKVLPVPRVPAAQHVVVERLSRRFFRVSIYYGFMEEQDVPATLEWCGEQGLALEPMATSYFIGRETVLPRVHRGMSAWRQRLFAAMFRNAGTSADHFKLPPNRVVELGTQVTL